MNILNEQQLKEIAKIIDNHVGVMMHIVTGDGKPDSDLMKKLGITQGFVDMLRNSYILGKLVMMLKETDLSKVTFAELKEKAKEFSLTTVERNSLKYAREQAGRYVTALGQKISGAVNGAITNANQQANLEVIQRNIIKDTTAQSILKQQTRGKLASELGHNIGDWKRDWQRVAHTEMWNAKLQGEVITILQGEAIYSNTKGGETTVFRRPAPDACIHCKRLYLESDGVTPRLFKLSELVNNGNNVGKKVGDWLPITGTTHPNCTCPIAVMPEGFGFDARGDIEFKG